MISDKLAWLQYNSMLKTSNTCTSSKHACMHACAELPCDYPQETLTERALELLALPQDGIPKLLLDLGCGSGLSGESLTKHGHTWVVSDS